MQAGNAQFLRDEVKPKQSSQRHVALHFGQKPHAVIIACSDSRVPPVSARWVEGGVAWVAWVEGWIDGWMEGGMAWHGMAWHGMAWVNERAGRLLLNAHPPHTYTRTTRLCRR